MFPDPPGIKKQVRELPLPHLSWCSLMHETLSLWSDNSSALWVAMRVRQVLYFVVKEPLEGTVPWVPWRTSICIIIQKEEQILSVFPQTWRVTSLLKGGLILTSQCLFAAVLGTDIPNEALELAGCCLESRCRFFVKDWATACLNSSLPLPRVALELHGT